MSKSIDPMLLKPGTKPFPASPRPIVSMSLRSAIPWRFALQHCPPPLCRPVSIFKPEEVICQRLPSGKYQNWTRKAPTRQNINSGVGQIKVSKWARPEYQTQFGRSHLEHGMEPLVEIGGGLFEDGSGQRRNLSSAVIATVDLSASDAVVLPFHLALRTDGDTARKPLLHDVVETGVIVGELRAEVVDSAFLRLVQYVVSALNVAHIQILCCFFYVMSRDNCHPACWQVRPCESSVLGESCETETGQGSRQNPFEHALKPVVPASERQ